MKVGPRCGAHIPKFSDISCFMLLHSKFIKLWLCSTLSWGRPCVDEERDCLEPGQVLNLSHDLLLQGSSVGVVPGYGMDDRGVGVWVQVEARISSSQSPDWLWGPPSFLYDYLGVKRPGRGSGHLPPTSADVKNTWIYTSTPPYAFVA
jgi:hypothetical protein